MIYPNERGRRELLRRYTLLQIDNDPLLTYLADMRRLINDRTY